MFLCFFFLAKYFFDMLFVTVSSFVAFCQGDSSEMFQCVDSVQNSVQDEPGLHVTSPKGDLEAYKVGTVSEEPSAGEMICISTLYNECTNFYAAIVSPYPSCKCV